VGVSMTFGTRKYRELEWGQGLAFIAIISEEL
jgi:hypothetical protein